MDFNQKEQKWQSDYGSIGDIANPDYPETVIITEVNGEFVTIACDENLQTQTDSAITSFTDEPSVTTEQMPFVASGPSTQQLPAKQKDNKGLIAGIGIGVLLTITGIQIWNSHRTIGVNAAIPAYTDLDSTVAQSVTVAPVKTASVNHTLKATGDVDAYELIPVMSQATGLQIKQVLVDEGESVKAGQILARLDDSILQAQLAQAQAEVSQAEARLQELLAGNRSEEIAQAQAQVTNAEQAILQAQSDLELVQKRVERNRTLEAEGAIARDLLDEVLTQERISKANLEQANSKLQEASQKLAQLKSGARSEVISQAKAQLAKAQGQVQLVEAQLKDTQVIAPVNGIIADKKALVGDITSPSKDLFEIIADGRLELRLKVPETQLLQVRPGQKVVVTSDVDRNLKLQGRVREIEPIIDQQSRQGIVKVDISANPNLKPGMFLRGEITTAAGLGLTVPADSLLPQSDGTAIVYMVQPDNSVKAQKVEMGDILASEQVEIKKGLELGDRIVVKGAAYLKDGDRVEIVSDF